MGPWTTRRPRRVRSPPGNGNATTWPRSDGSTGRSRGDRPVGKGSEHAPDGRKEFESMRTTHISAAVWASVICFGAADPCGLARADGCEEPRFAGARAIGSVGFPYSVVSSDFDGDGTADLATANFTAGSISILRGSGHGRFQT